MQNRHATSRPGRMSCALLAAIVDTIAGIAAAAAASPQDESWQFEMTPYVWGIALKGSTGIGSSTTVKVDSSFSDILDVLDFAFMTSLEARKGPFGLFFDGIYTKRSSTASASRSGPRRVGGHRTEEPRPWRRPASVRRPRCTGLGSPPPRR